MPTRSGAPHERINTRSHAGLAMDEGKGRDLGKIEVTKVVELSHDYTGPTVR